MWRRGLVVVALAGALVGCAATPSTAPSPAPATSAAKPVVRVATTDNSSVPSAPTGSDQGPSASGADPAAGVYDPSAQARANFLAWWNYEAQVALDVSRPADEVYRAGISVCEQREQGVDTDVIQRLITRDNGYTGSGAAGIYQAALQSLCPNFNAGYKTNFDRNTDLAYAAITARVTYSPVPWPLFDFGFFMKEACAFMGSVPASGTQIYAHLRGSTQLALVEQGNVQVAVLNIYIKEAVNAGCTIMNDQLPPVIQLA
jgi:hypothetical protein